MDNVGFVDQLVDLFKRGVALRDRHKLLLVKHDKLLHARGEAVQKAFRLGTEIFGGSDWAGTENSRTSRLHVRPPLGSLQITFHLAVAEG